MTEKRSAALSEDETNLAAAAAAAISMLINGEYDLKNGALRSLSTILGAAGAVATAVPGYAPLGAALTVTSDLFGGPHPHEQLMAKMDEINKNMDQ